MKYVYGLTLAVLLLAGCASSSAPKVDDQVECQAIFDAGSTGTRLWIYYKDGDAWKGKEIKKTSALANLLTRTVDHEAATEAVEVLEQFKKTMKNSKCDSISSIRVLATAGMRLAEKHDDTSSKFWQKLFDALSVKNKNVTVATRTIPGYEEGIYAWLAARNKRETKKLSTDDFGLAELGGASVQVTFPCGKSCPDGRVVKVAGKKIKIFNHSFLNLGTNEASQALGYPDLPDSCKHAAGKNKGWKKETCRDLISGKLVKRDGKIWDPTPKTFIKIQDRRHVGKWSFAGSFAYMDSGNNKNVQDCCIDGLKDERSCYKWENSCFVAIYRPVLLEALQIDHTDNKNVYKSATNWTLGALICEETNCLPKRAPDECLWLTNSKCLAPPKKNETQKAKK